MVFDRKYLDIDTGKYNTDKISSIKGYSLGDVIDGCVHNNMHYGDERHHVSPARDYLQGYSLRHLKNPQILVSDESVIETSTNCCEKINKPESINYEGIASRGMIAARQDREKKARDKVIECKERQAAYDELRKAQEKNEIALKAIQEKIELTNKVRERIDQDYKNRIIYIGGPHSGRPYTGNIRPNTWVKK
jgi:hypothetical protein